MKLKIRYLEHGQIKTVTITTTEEQIKLWNRQQNGEITVIEAKRLNGD